MNTTLEQSVSPAAALIGPLTALPSSPPFALRTWDGAVWSKGNPTFTIVLNSPQTLARLLFSQDELELGEAFIYRQLDVEGDLEAAVDYAQFLFHHHWTVADKLRLAGSIMDLRALAHHGDENGFSSHRSLHSKERDRRAVSFHYDVSNDFYKLWLDRRLVYSCAYFESGKEDLEIAQAQKLDHICRKLRLKPGEKLLDIGCGWGGLVLYAAENFGVQACGVTVSEAQAELARERAAELGVADRCEIRLCDYRDLSPDTGFDKIVSVGMFEHVGESHLPEYFANVFRLLRPGGVFLNHGIAAAASFHRKGGSFISKYVFPDGELVPLGTTVKIAEGAGFEVRDVESLREHYARTLRLWVRRLEAHAAEAIAATSDATYRIWRLYMAGCAHAFQKGRVSVYQVLFSKPEDGDARLPWTRADWYVE